jgi:hypothetical protein
MFTDLHIGVCDGDAAQQKIILDHYVNCILDLDNYEFTYDS